MSNKKQKIKEFFKSERFHFGLLSFLIVVLIAIGILCPRLVSDNSRFLNHDSNTEIVERKSRIVNNNEIWSDNLFNYNKYFGSDTDIIDISKNNLRFNVDNEYNRTFYLSVYNNDFLVRTYLSSSDDYNYSYDWYISSAEQNYTLRLFVYDGSSYILNYRFGDIFALSTVNYVQFELRFSDSFVDINNMSISQGVKPINYSPYGQIGYTTEYLDYVKFNARSDNFFNGASLVGYDSPSGRNTFGYADDYYNVLRDNYTFNFDELITHIPSSAIYNDTYFPYALNGGGFLFTSIKQGFIKFEISDSVNFVDLYINSFDRKLGYLVNGYVRVPNPNYKTSLVYSFDIFDIIQDKTYYVLTGQNDDNFVANISEIYNGLERFNYTSDSYVGLGYVTLGVKTSYKINVTIRAIRSDYSNGYEDGLQAGIYRGEYIVTQNPNNYGLYTYQDYINYGQYQFNEGLTKTHPFNFKSFFFGVLNAPINAVKQAMNFEFMGVNMKDFFTGLLTCVVSIGIVSFILKKVL